MHTHILIIVVLDALAILLISSLLLTTYIHRQRIPRHPVITTLLATAIPRILVLALPYFVEDRLVADLPFHQRLRTDAQQHTPLAKFCAFQALTATYLLSSHAGFIVSFTLSLLHIVTHPNSHTRQLKPSYRLATSSWFPTSNRTLFSYLLCIGPFLFSLPIPILGLVLILLQQHNKLPLSPDPTMRFGKQRHIIYYQGTYCNLDIYSFQFLSGFMTGLPLIVALGVLAYVVLLVVRFYLKDGRIYESRSRSRFHLPSLRHSKSRKRLSPTPLQSPSVLKPPLALTLRIALLVIEILVTTVMFLLQVSLSDPTQFLKVDRYWEAIAPLLEFMIFASQSAVLEVWFPSVFGPSRVVEPSTRYNRYDYGLGGKRVGRVPASPIQFEHRGWTNADMDMEGIDYDDDDDDEEEEEEEGEMADSDPCDGKSEAPTPDTSASPTAVRSRTLSEESGTLSGLEQGGSRDFVLTPCGSKSGDGEEEEEEGEEEKDGKETDEGVVDGSGDELTQEARRLTLFLPFPGLGLERLVERVMGSFQEEEESNEFELTVHPRLQGSTSSRHLSSSSSPPHSPKLPSSSSPTLSPPPTQRKQRKRRLPDPAIPTFLRDRTSTVTTTTISPSSSLSVSICTSPHSDSRPPQPRPRPTNERTSTSTLSERQRQQQGLCSADDPDDPTFIERSRSGRSENSGSSGSAGRRRMEGTDDIGMSDLRSADVPIKFPAR